MVIWENDKWMVSDFGLESIKRGAYEIAADDLLDARGTFYAWPLHMAEKVWIDIDAFCQAFELALIWHHCDGYSLPRLRRSIAEALRMRRANEEFERRIVPSLTYGRFRFIDRDQLELAA